MWPLADRVKNLIEKKWPGLSDSSMTYGVVINFPRTWGEQRIPGAWKGHPVHPFLFVFAQKTDKFRFTATGMPTVCRRCSAGSQSHPHILWFASGLRTIRHTRVYEALQIAITSEQTDIDHFFLLLKMQNFIDFYFIWKNIKKFFRLKNYIFEMMTLILNTIFQGRFIKKCWATLTFSGTNQSIFSFSENRSNRCFDVFFHDKLLSNKDSTWNTEIHSTPKYDPIYYE